MDCIATELPDVKVLIPKFFGDHRGFFAETFSRRVLAGFGIDHEFVQDNHSMSAKAGTIRGLHYQLPPMAQGKLLRVVKGAIRDVAVDIRRGSATFGKSVAVELSAENHRMLWVPVGFAHGFVTLAPDTEVFYKVTNYYSPPHERGIAWNDPSIAVPWGVCEGDATLSDRDRVHPVLSQQPDLL